MRFKRMFTTIDTHTCGDPTRTVIGGLPYIPGKTIPEKMQYLQENADWIRQILMFEPRGNEVQSGAILTEPCSEEADIGVIYIEVGGYLYMCGHDTIGVATALIESGIIEPKEPYTYINLETPAGIVKVKVKVKDNVAKEVTFVNVPAFMFEKDVEIEIPEIGTVSVDVAYGGLFYAQVEASDFGLKGTKDEYKQLQYYGNIIKDKINEKIDVYHPEKKFINEVTHILFCGPAETPEGSLKNACIIPPGSVSRSPCGTGTSARMATLFKKGELEMKEQFNHESAMTQTIFKGRVLEEVKLGEFDAIIPEITASAYVTGMHTFVIDPEDPIQKGFRLD